MPNLKIEVLYDEYPHFRIVQFGNWVLMHDYETGEGEWNWREYANEADVRYTHSQVHASA